MPLETENFSENFVNIVNSFSLYLLTCKYFKLCLTSIGSSTVFLIRWRPELKHTLRASTQVRPAKQRGDGCLVITRIR